MQSQAPYSDPDNWTRDDDRAVVKPVKLRFALVLESSEADHGAAHRKLRAALKWLGRVHRLRCVSVRPAEKA